MVFPDTMYGLLPKGTGKITLHESKPAPMTKDEAISTERALDLALEALEESVDLVREDYENAKKLYSNYPSRQARLLGLEDGLSKHEAAITAIKQARALDKKAENDRALGLDYEPVGWWDAKIGFFEEKHFDQLQPLYTTPPAARGKWVGLPFGEICEAEVIATDEHNNFSLLTFARAIEAKLKERNV
jgi:hypothetical protein